MAEIIKEKMSCIDCGMCACNRGGNHPDFCMSRKYEGTDIREEARILYQDEENRKVSKAAAEVELENYCRMTRLEEIAEFAKKIGAKKLGIASCVGLISEARAAGRYYRAKGFDIISTVCKIGEIPKSEIGIEAGDLGPHMCNPIMQAKVLNKEKTELNIVIGLCVGHDSIFYKYSDALCTTLVTKDRVLGHNPAAALYQLDGYYKKLLSDENT